MWTQHLRMNKLGSKSWLLLTWNRTFCNFLTTLELQKQNIAHCVNSNFLQSSESPQSWTNLHSLQIHTQPTPRHQQSHIPATNEKHPAIPQIASRWSETSSPLSIQKRKKRGNSAKSKLENEQIGASIAIVEGKSETFSLPPIASAIVANVWNVYTLAQVWNAQVPRVNSILNFHHITSNRTCMLPTTSNPANCLQLR